MTIPLETTDLSKRYGDVVAVDRLSLSVREGEIYGFLGLNGAGKTTTIRMLLGLIHPSGGTLRVLGHEIRSGNTPPWADVGYLVETANAYPELTVRENLEVVRRLRGCLDSNVVPLTIEQLGLAEYADRPVRTLSLGNAQRLGLAKALMHRPRLLLLDEPANGLDPAGIVEVRDLLRELTQREGATVFMSSHILSEVSRLATRIGIIHQGRLLKEIDAEELEKQRRRQLFVDARNREAARSVLSKAGYTCEGGKEEPLEVLNSAAHEKPEEIARILSEAGHPPTLLALQQEDLESYFLRLVSSREGGAE